MARLRFMKLLELLNAANEGYPDGYLAEYYDTKTGALKKHGSGDTLAKFIVPELIDTFDSKASDDSPKLMKQGVSLRVLEEIFSASSKRWTMDRTLNAFEALEFLVLGIHGKWAMWRALSVVAADDSRLDGLITRAPPCARSPTQGPSSVRGRKGGPQRTRLLPVIAAAFGDNARLGSQSRKCCGCSIRKHKRISVCLLFSLTLTAL